MIEIQFHPVSRLRHRPIAEVGRPSPHHAVQAPRHVFPWRVITGPQASPDMLLDRGHSLLGRPRTVVASAGSRRVHRPEGIAEEVEGLASGVAYTRLGLVQRETDAGHPSPSRFEDLTGAMPTQDHEIVRVGHQHRVVPTIQTMLAKRLDETMHVDVRQQWRCHSTLRCSPRRLLAATHPPMSPFAGLLDRRLQPHLDQMQHLPVANTSCNALDQLGVGNRIEVFR